MRVSTSKTRTVGASNGKIKAKADAKMMATTQQLMAYEGSYVRGYTADTRQCEPIGQSSGHSQERHTSEPLPRGYGGPFRSNNFP